MNIEKPKNQVITFDDLLLPNEHINNLSGKDWIGVCDTYNMLNRINVLTDISWNDYRNIKITNKRTYYEIVKCWIDNEFDGVKNMDYKPSKAFAYWVYTECRKLKAGL